MNPETTILVGDCLDTMQGMETDSVDLVFTSPPYEAARTYGIDFKLQGSAWVDWALVRFCECLRVCKGLVAWVVEGRTKNYSYSATPLRLAVWLQDRGKFLRKPPVFHRVGIPGSGGPDWLRNDYEFIVCATRKRGKLPWSDNTAMGHPPKWAPGGAMSHRVSDGIRVNQWGHSIESGATIVANDGTVRSSGKRPSHRNQWGGTGGTTGNRKVDGSKETRSRPSHLYQDAPPVKANPGNVVRCNVGGGLMGSDLAHENEAPFPEVLADFFVRSFCPPDGVVLDPFGGSGTTLAAAILTGRNSIGIDLRESQAELMRKRVEEARRRIANPEPLREIPDVDGQLTFKEM